LKNQYFGDVNDYRKYGLLRALSSVTGLPVGVCWLLTMDDGRSDGEFRRYLEEPVRFYPGGEAWSSSVHIKTDSGI
jgi:hypothetical protein